MSASVVTFLSLAPKASRLCVEESKGVSAKALNEISPTRITDLRRFEMIGIGMLNVETGDVMILPPVPAGIQVAALTDLRDALELGADLQDAVTLAALSAGRDAFEATGSEDFARRAEGMITAWLIGTLAEMFAEAEAQENKSE